MRIILTKKELDGDRITLSGEKARYLISVLRCSVGDELQIFDGEGHSRNAKIAGIDSRRVTIDLFEKIPVDTESPLNLILVQGILKGEKMDWVVQKATELGIREIIPAVTERCQVRKTRKAERWKKIAEEASKQSGRTSVPVIHEPADFSFRLKSQISSQLGGLIFYEGGGLRLSEAVRQINMNPEPSAVYLAIGPEGGFTGNEVVLANSMGLITVSLGKRILRAETAVVASVAIMQFLFGDIG